MKGIKAIALLFAIASISCAYIDKGFILDKFMDSPKELFKAYYTLFNKEEHYDINSPEGISRFDIFKQNVDWIKSENAKAGKQVYGITQFTDLSNEEYQAIHLMKTEHLERMFKTSFRDIKQTVAIPSPFGSSVTQVDWRSYMNPIKDQGQCGSCWAFGATATTEGNYNINFGTLYNLSEQYVVSCDNVDQGCNGGWPTNTGTFMANNGVVQTKDFAPYSASKGVCPTNIANKLNIVSSFEECSNCTADQWYAILAKGPIIVATDGQSAGFRNYKPASLDIPMTPTCTQINHAVNIVGVQVVNGRTLLIGRNQWGTSWGYNGSFSIDAANPCYMMNYAWRAVTKKDEPNPDPKPDPDPNPDPVPPTNCPIFASTCDSSAKKVSNCFGIENASAVLGTTIKGWSNTFTSLYWNFYQNSHCTGLVDWKFASETCFNNWFSFNNLKEYGSAANNNDKPDIGCVIVYTGHCATGTRMNICSNIADLTGSGLTSIGTVVFNWFKYWPGNAIAITLYDQPNFTGNAVSLNQGQYYNLDNQTNFINMVSKAKSLALVKYSY